MAHCLFKRTTLPNDYCKFSELRAKCKRLSKLNYEAYINTSQTQLTQSPRNFWKYFRDLNRQTSIPSNVKYGSLTASSDLESASFFSEYFASVFKPVTSSSSPALPFVHPYSLPSNCYFSPDDVLSSLDKLKSVSTNGPVGISASLLFQCRLSLFFPLCLLFRKCLDEGVFPSVLKISSVTPILKSSDPSLVSNYRPISISPHIAIIFESIIFNYLGPKLNHILIPQQHGFRTGRSTISCSVSFSSLVYDCISSGAQVDVIFSDFSKAFDTVPHNLLINELDRIGIGPCSVLTCPTVSKMLN